MTRQRLPLHRLNRYGTPRCRQLAIGMLLIGAGFIAGCQQEVQTVPSGEVLAQRAKFLLDSAPAEPMGVKEAKAAVKEPTEIVLAGTIDAGKQEPWEDGKALFLITETSIAEHDHADGSHDNCPFCNTAKANNLALIKFVDDAGETVAIDARDLFGIAKGQQVIVQGMCNVDPSGTLVVIASGLYIES